MRIIPQFLQTVIQEYKQELLIWASDQIYQRLQAWEQEDPLIEVAQIINWQELEATCAGYHHQQGRGRPVAHSVAKLLRVLLIRYWYDLSLRETERKVRQHMVAKWFAGYHLFARGPDHTRIQAFEAWLMATHPRLFFDTILDQIAAARPVMWRQLQYGDTFAMLANAQREGPTARIRHGCRLLLRVLKKEDPLGHARVEAALNQALLWGPQKAKGTHQLSPSERQARRRQTATEAARLLQLVAAETGGEKTAEAQALLRRILAEIYRLSQAADGGLILGRGRFQKVAEADYPLYSVTDPEATIRNHGENKVTFGYNAALATDQDFVCEIQARPGSENDAQTIVPLLLAQAAHHACQPEKLVYDQAAGTGKVAADVAAATQGQTQLVVQPVDYAQRRPVFGPADFCLSPDHETVSCPAGQRSGCRYRPSAGAGWVYRFYPSTCRDCPLRTQCRQNPDKTNTRRDVFFNHYQFFAARLRAYAQTDAFANEMAGRSHVERIIALLVRYNGARRARFRGRAKVDFQLKMCATAYNLKRWVALRRQRSKPPPAKGPPPAAAALAGSMA